MQIIFILWVSILFIGCAPKSYTINESKLIIIKTPKFKYADLGYVRKNKNEVKIDLFIAGNLIQSFEIDTLICANEGCMRKSSFNEEFLNSSYHYDILKNIFLASPIFESKNLEKTSTGFEQNIKTKDYDITYKIENDEVYFKDKQNKILIKIKKIKG